MNARLLVLATACAAASATAMESTAAQFEMTIAPEKFDEHCLRLEAGEAIAWRFTATGRVNFNIHRHQGDEVLYPVRRDRVERASGVFRARDGDDYCLMWTGRAGGPVVVRGSVERRR